ncbi:50S ribosomal protein L18e [Candidatus Woesearchaeota archaeon]|jgi:large subunit ribosomal protein L18e|nr:50S ribosomal protein L18e [Candidatus Woesearchaeota archaeon]MBT4368781.1 50S ribosomal protein L18e [Candidatus Woesearchaeota archaeon]MBT4712070.1 50S ribosomal protein L18e [Candidatus Woesearchaeota archaeon]MBT6639182.1 50S ribosomal protein L18e [Candidatus Woesearchaeota archaeon]MBT7134382.1 50S ribosomal protein L18e [Candidatus Woesearchaeota archaeon]
MVKRTGPANYQLQQLIRELKKKSIEDKAGLWKRIAVDLEKPSRQRRVVNISRVNKFCKDNEIIVVPGKLLAEGELSKKVNIAAFSFSESAKDKIEKASAQIMTIQELMKKNPKTSEVRIIG